MTGTSPNAVADGIVPIVISVGFGGCGGGGGGGGGGGEE